VTFEIGANLSNVLIALIAGVPAIVAALYARSASKQATAVHTELVNGGFAATTPENQEHNG